MALRIALTIGIFVLCLFLVQMVRMRTAVTRAASTVSAGSFSSGASKADARETDRMWPLFAGARSSGMQEMVLNGVRLISESFQTTASAAEILDYYRDQMAARGWRDITERQFGLEPELQELGGPKDSVQRDNYVQSYEEIVESFLVLNRGEWCIQIALEPGLDPRHRSVSVFAARTRDLGEFSREVAGRTITAAAGPANTEVAEVSEVAGGTRFHTRMTTARANPASACAAMLRELEKAGWQKVAAGAGTDAGSDRFTVLQRGDDVGYLAVVGTSGERGSSILFTEMSNDQPQMNADARR